ncbi:MAG: hypothetical protein AB7F41_14580 [Methylocystis sp.]|uniref:hypothetical protein n=1 Tax=Methylocystis sp. TaxID=1911079 RepID=UPI003D138BF3
MSKVIKGVGRIGGSILGLAAPFLPAPFNFIAGGAGIGLGLLGGSGGGKKDSIDYQQLLQLLQRPPPLSQTVRGSNTPRILAFGRVRQAGVSFCRETTPNLYNFVDALYLNDGPVDGFDAMICDDELAPLDNLDPFLMVTRFDYFWPASGKKTSSGAFGNINSYVMVEFVNATRQGKWSTLLRGDSSGKLRSFDAGWDPFWDATHLGKGVTILYTVAYSTANTADRLKVFPNGFPVYSVIYRGARVYDPRDPGQTFSDSDFDLYNETWKFSENPALCAAHYVNWLISENLTAIRGVDWASIKEAADDCDRLAPISRNGFNNGVQSYEPFARVSALVTLDMEPREVLAKFMECCDGDWGIDQNGRFTVWVNKWREPAIVFTGRDIGDFVEQFGAPSSEQINYMHVSYIEPRQGHNRVETQPFRDLASEGDVGRRTGAVVFDWVTSADQAYRLAARRVKRNVRKRRLSVSLGARAMTALQQRVVGVNAPQIGVVGTFRVESLAPTDATLATWQAELVEVTEDQFVDEAIPQDPIFALPIVNQPAIGTPTALIAAALSTGPGVGVAQLSLDANVNSPVQANSSITAAALLTDPTLQLDGRWSIDGGATWTNFSVLLSALIMQTPELPRGTVVTMQARFVSSAGSVGSYSSSASATIP